MRKQDPTSSHQNRTPSHDPGNRLMAGAPGGPWSWKSQQGSLPTRGGDRTWNHKAWRQHPTPTPTPTLTAGTVKSQELISFVSNALSMWPRPTAGCFLLLPQLRLRPAFSHSTRMTLALLSLRFVLDIFPGGSRSWRSLTPAEAGPAQVRKRPSNRNTISTRCSLHRRQLELQPYDLGPRFISPVPQFLICDHRGTGWEKNRHCTEHPLFLPGLESSGRSTAQTGFQLPQLLAFQLTSGEGSKV